MTFMLLIYNNAATLEGLPSRSGTSSSTAKTIRIKDGAVAATDGPFAEAKEQFAGYVAVDCESEERAVEIARRWPDPRFGGAIEVRAVMSQAGTEM